MRLCHTGEDSKPSFSLLGRSSAHSISGHPPETRKTHPTDDTIMRRQMCLAVLAPKDPIRVQIHIVSQPHLVYFLFRKYAQRTIRNSEGSAIGRLVIVAKSDRESGGMVDISITMLSATETWDDDGHKGSWLLSGAGSRWM